MTDELNVAHSSTAELLSFLWLVERVKSSFQDFGEAFVLNNINQSLINHKTIVSVRFSENSAG